MSSTLQLELEGRGACTLRPGDFLAQGGEASVYRYGDYTVKVYTDPAKMSRDDMAGKIRLLRELRHPHIFAPRGIVLNKKGNPVGFYMPLAEGEPMPRIFTSAFWQRSSFDVGQASILAERMRDVVSYAHGHGAVMVDPNELNWLSRFSRSGPEPQAIDVDSWAIGQWKAKVIMPSIRDWHAKDFTELSDWFSWGVVTFQLFIGIHPYRGTLPGYGNLPSDLEARMKANASVFSPGVRLNRTVRDFNSIPGPLLDWYRVTFQHGSRSAPPSPLDMGASLAWPALVRHASTSATGMLIFEKLLERPSDAVIRTFPCGAVQTRTGEVWDIASLQKIGQLGLRGEVVRVDRGWLLADWEEEAPTYSFVDDRTRERQVLGLSLRGYRHVRFENRLFLAAEHGLIELNFLYAGRPLLSPGRRIQILHSRSTKWFDGVGVEEALGATFLVLPFGDDSCATTRVKELDGLVPVAAKAGNRFAAVVALDKSGGYHKLEFSFSADYASYKLWQGTAADPSLNLAVLSTKLVCATITTDGELVVFVPLNGSVTRVQDRMATTDIVLGNWGDRVVGIKDGALWGIRMRAP